MLVRKGGRPGGGGAAPSGGPGGGRGMLGGGGPGGGLGMPAAEPANDLDMFAREVLEALSNDNLPPFPNYYQLYFEKLLDEKPYDFRKNINELMESESGAEDEKRMRIEQQLQEGFSISKEILQNVATLYKNVNTMSTVSKKRIVDAKGINNPSAVKNLTLALGNDLDKLVGVLNRQAGAIKTLYTKSAKIIKEVEGETIYDATYGIFNRRYLLEQIGAELKAMKKFEHSSSMIVARLHRNIVDEVQSEKQIALINRTVSKLFLKTSRRSDVVAHIGDGVFSMLLKHTDVDNAVRAATRLSEMLAASHFFIGDKEVRLQISIGIIALSQDEEVEMILANALDAMEEADHDEEALYKVFNQEGMDEDDDDDFDLS